MIMMMMMMMMVHSHNDEQVINELQGCPDVELSMVEQSEASSAAFRRSLHTAVHASVVRVINKAYTDGFGASQAGIR